jgi:hypothetical protein
LSTRVGKLEAKSLAAEGRARVVSSLKFGGDKIYVYGGNLILSASNNTVKLTMEYDSSPQTIPLSPSSESGGSGGNIAPTSCPNCGHNAYHNYDEGLGLVQCSNCN